MMTDETPTHFLVLNSAEGFLQVIIGRSMDSTSKYELLCSQDWRVVSQGAEMLTPLIGSTLERLRLTIKDISQIACVSGPGSFTGIRLAVSTAAGLARALQGSVLQAGLPFMPLLARSVAVRAPWFFQENTPASTIWALTHARRNLVHLQGFSSCSVVKENPCPLSEVVAVSLADAAKIILSQEGVAFLVGSGVNRNRQDLLALLPEATFFPDSYATVEPEVFMEQAAFCSFSEQDIEPVYIRPCDAEDNLDAIAVSLGNDPQKSRMALARLTGVSK